MILTEVDEGIVLVVLNTVLKWLHTIAIRKETMLNTINSLLFWQLLVNSKETRTYRSCYYCFWLFVCIFPHVDHPRDRDQGTHNKGMCIIISRDRLTWETIPHFSHATSLSLRSSCIDFPSSSFCLVHPPFYRPFLLSP